MTRHDDPAQSAPDPDSFTRELKKLSPAARRQAAENMGNSVSKRLTKRLLGKKPN